MGKIVRALVAVGLLIAGQGLATSVLAQEAAAPKVVSGAGSPGAATTPSLAMASVLPSPAAIGSPPPTPALPAPSTGGAVAAPPGGPNRPTTPVGEQTAALTAPVIDHRDDTAEGERLLRQSIDGARDDPFNWSLHIFKARHRVEVFFKGRLIRTYHAVFGRSRWAGGKQWEGDTRTPEGSYLIVAKHRSARFRWFLRLNYPNGLDQERFVALQAAKQIPARLHEGGQVGIHGTDSPVLNLRDVNWTLGCISVNNTDIDEMARLLPVGTLVVINP